MNKRNLDRGFTLIEVILSIAIASGVALSVFTSFQLVDAVRVRQEHMGIVMWEGDLILHRLRLLVSRGVQAPSPQDESHELHLGDGSVVTVENDGLVITASGQTTLLSSSRVRVQSFSVRDNGSVQHSGLLRIDMVLSSVSPDSRTAYERNYSTSIYAE